MPPQRRRRFHSSPRGKRLCALGQLLEHWPSLRSGHYSKRVPWERGVQGGGNEPPGRRTDAAKSLARMPDRRPPPLDALGMHSTIRAAARSGRTCAGPGIRIRRAAPSFGHPQQWHRCVTAGSTQLRADATGPLGVGCAWPSEAAPLHGVARLGLRPALPERACCHARVSDHAASPSSGPGACAPAPRWPASCAPCRD